MYHERLELERANSITINVMRMLQTKRSGNH